MIAELFINKKEHSFQMKDDPWMLKVTVKKDWLGWVGVEMSIDKGIRVTEEVIQGR